MSKYIQNRRNFIKNASLVSAGLSTSASSLFNLKNMGAFSAQNLGGPTDYKALVCIYLGGGSDSFNMLVPRGNSEYAEYAATRSNLALPQDQLLAINPINIAGVQYGLNPMMPNVQQLFDQGRICMFSNMGPLVNPVTKDDYYNGTGNFPLGLFSHSDQTNHWQNASPSMRQNIGWAGRISDLLHDANTNSDISMNVSFAGTNIFQSANEKIVFTVDSGGALSLSGYDREAMYGHDQKRSFAIDDIMAYGYNDPFKDTYRKVFRNSLDSSIFFNKIIDEVPEFNTVFSDNYLSNNLSMVSKIMYAREQLGFNRQIFFLDFGGWDTHDNLFEDLNYLYMRVDAALGEFNAAIEELGLRDNVVTFTMSEFGRTLTSNGNGTDHAWGGNVLAMGGPVIGNKIYGDYPSLALDNPLDIGGGVLIPTTPNDLYFAELAMWYGVAPSDLHAIFPNLGNFYAQGSTHQPLGFLNI